MTDRRAIRRYRSSSLMRWVTPPKPSPPPPPPLPPDELSVERAARDAAEQEAAHLMRERDLARAEATEATHRLKVTRETARRLEAELAETSALVDDAQSKASAAELAMGKAKAEGQATRERVVALEGAIEDALADLDALIEMMAPSDVEINTRIALGIRDALRTKKAGSTQAPRRSRWRCMKCRKIFGVATEGGLCSTCKRVVDRYRAASAAPDLLDVVDALVEGGRDE